MAAARRSSVNLRPCSRICCDVRICVYTCTHTHIHARTHARTHTHTHSHTLTHTHTNGLRPCSKICCDLRICCEVSLLEDASVLQCAVVCCSVLQCAAVRCSHLTQGCLVTSRKSLFSVNLSFALHNGIVCGWKDSAQ